MHSLVGSPRPLSLSSILLPTFHCTLVEHSNAVGETRKNIYGKNGSVVFLDGTYTVVTLSLQIILEKYFFQIDVKIILTYL